MLTKPALYMVKYTWRGEPNGWSRACSKLCAERAAVKHWKLGEGHDATVEPLPKSQIDITNPEVNACAFCQTRLTAV